MERPKLQAVARAAGVSVSTVSKVLNGRPDVAPATRTRVADLLGRAGYPEVGGRGGRRTGAGDLVEVVTHRLDDRSTSRLLRAVCLEAGMRGLGVVVTDVDPAVGRAGRHPPRRWLDAVDARGAGAAISLLMHFSDAQLSYFDAHGVTACAVGAAEPRSGEHAVRVDEYDLGRVAVRHLLDLGHTHVAVVAGPGHPRLAQGCREMLLTAGTHTLDEYRPEPDDVRRATHDLLTSLTSPTPPSAVIVAEDDAARAACAAVAAAGLRVPRDVSVVCCDMYSSEPVTTVAAPLREMARAALDLLAAAHETTAVVTVPPQLMEHGTTAAPRPPGPA